MTKAIVWFRQDLRCHDNPALITACHNHQSIIPLYIADKNPKETVGGAQCWWLHHSLLALDKQLKKHHLKLCLKRGSALEILTDLIQQHKIDAIYWNQRYEPENIAQDKTIKEALEDLNVVIEDFNSHLLLEPWTIHNKSGDYFKVFTPYWKQALKQIDIPPMPRIKEWPSCSRFKSEQLDDWELLPTKPNWAKQFADFWQPGEQGALKKLRTFIDQHLNSYKEGRDKPATQSTSRLSPHLHFGEISPWTIWQAVKEAKQDPDCNLAAAEQFLTELGWREFSYYLLFHFSKLPDKNFKESFDEFAWLQNDEDLVSWQRGLTGFPIVDAGMRELWQTGFMHNRVRMITASFLTKDLLLDWRLGADWFLDTLLDADLAANSFNWQWVAGSGADAAPYFRIFNPVLQGEKFDPQGEYVKRWVPELNKVPTKWVHKPWEAPKAQLNITLGKDYPFPIVDHNEARKIALQNYQAIKKPAKKVYNS